MMVVLLLLLLLLFVSFRDMGPCWYDLDTDSVLTPRVIDKRFDMTSLVLVSRLNSDLILFRIGHIGGSQQTVNESFNLVISLYHSYSSSNIFKEVSDSDV